MNVEYRMQLAGVDIQVECCFASTKKFCADYIVEDNSSECISVSVCQRDIEYEREVSAEYDRSHGEMVRNWQDEYLETLALYRKIAEKLIHHDVLLLHGSAALIDGKAYLFTGPSGAGKSTHAALWCELLRDEHDVRMINDDKPLVSFGESGIIIYGTPWDGKHHRSANISGQLSAVARINQSDTNHTELMKSEDKWPLLLSQCYRPDDVMNLQHTIGMLERLNKEIPFFEIYCNTEIDAANCSWEVIRNETGGWIYNS